MTAEIIEYQKGQKLHVPRSMRPMIEEIISRRERYEVEAFRRMGELFGLGAVDIGPDQAWMFALDKPKGVAFCFLKDDPEAERIKEVSIDDAMESVMKLEAAKVSNQIIVNCIEMLIPAAEHYHWRLDPKEMVIEILDRKQPPDDLLDLSQLVNQGGMQ